MKQLLEYHWNILYISIFTFMNSYCGKEFITNRLDQLKAEWLGLEIVYHCRQLAVERSKCFVNPNREIWFPRRWQEDFHQDIFVELRADLSQGFLSDTHDFCKVPLLNCIQGVFPHLDEERNVLETDRALRVRDLGVDWVLGCFGAGKFPAVKTGDMSATGDVTVDRWPQANRAGNAGKGNNKILNRKKLNENCFWNSKYSKQGWVQHDLWAMSYLLI